MNWLAHLLLSDSTPQGRIGNILPDLMRMPQLETMPRVFQNGIARHRQIDSFTDSHAVVKRSVARIQPPFRRYGGVLVDVFYDHFLTRDWIEYSKFDRNDLVREFYASFDDLRDEIPPDAFRVLERMRDENWLSTYGDLAGVELTLRRISFRLKRPFPLEKAVVELKRNYADLHDDFRVFFPQLVAHLEPTQRIPIS